MSADVLAPFLVTSARLRPVEFQYLYGLQGRT